MNTKTATSGARVNGKREGDSVSNQSKNGMTAKRTNFEGERKLS